MAINAVDIHLIMTLLAVTLAVIFRPLSLIIEL
jgi:hypothetical protein